MEAHIQRAVAEILTLSIGCVWVGSRRVKRDGDWAQHLIQSHYNTYLAVMNIGQLRTEQRACYGTFSQSFVEIFCWVKITISPMSEKESERWGQRLGNSKWRACQEELSKPLGLTKLRGLGRDLIINCDDAAVTWMGRHALYLRNKSIHAHRHTCTAHMWWHVSTNALPPVGGLQLIAGLDNAFLFFFFLFENLTSRRDISSTSELHSYYFSLPTRWKWHVEHNNKCTLWLAFVHLGVTHDQIIEHRCHPSITQI